MSSRSATRRPSPASTAEQQPFLRSARESLPEVEALERMAEPIRHAPPVPGIDGRAAALLAVRARIVRPMRAGAHEQPDHVVPLLFQQVRADGAIYPAAHGENDTL